MDRQRIDELVREDQADDREARGRLGDLDVGRDGGQSCRELHTPMRVHLDRLQAERDPTADALAGRVGPPGRARCEKPRAIRAQAGHDRLEERTRPGAVLADGERVGAPEQPPAVVHLPGDRPAEDRASPGR